MTSLGASMVMSATWLGVDLAKTNDYRRILTRRQPPLRRVSTCHSDVDTCVRSAVRRAVLYYDVMLMLYDELSDLSGAGRY